MRSGVLSILLCVLAQFSAVQSTGQTTQPLKTAFETFSSDPALAGANWSFIVTDVTNGNEIISFNADRHIVPASVQKLVTTATAIQLLGHDYTYHTNIEYSGSISDDGILNGDLYIRGSGDPSLGSTRLDDSLSIERVFIKWHSYIVNAGIREIDGNIISDESIFDLEMIPRQWLWEDIGNYFGAGASGLTVNENQYTVYFNAGSSLGSPATVVDSSPYIPGMNFINEVTTARAGTGDQVYIFGIPYGNERRLTGTVPISARNFPVRGSMPDPPAFISKSFLEFLKDKGIKVTGKHSTYRTAPDDGIIVAGSRQQLGSWESPPLFDIIYHTNHASLNTYSENLLKTIGYKMAGSGSFESGLESLSGFWAGKGSSADLTGLRDGSGLSPVNRVPASSINDLLMISFNHPSFGVFLSSLPLAGYSGSIAGHLHGSRSEGILRAKSGFLSNVRAYAGYTVMTNGNMASFVLIVNDYQGSAAAMGQKMLRLLDSVTGHNGTPLM